MRTTIHTSKFRVPYMNAVIRKFAQRKELPLRDAFQYLWAYNGLALLDECYEAIHLQSIDDAVDDLTVVCQRNGGNIE